MDYPSDVKAPRIHARAHELTSGSHSVWWYIRDTRWAADSEEKASVESKSRDIDFSWVAVHLTGQSKSNLYSIF
jgi:hypothetical protein